MNLLPALGPVIAEFCSKSHSSLAQRRQSGYTRASSLGPIADVLGRQGGSILRVLKDVDLPVALLEAPEMLVPLREQFRLLERAARTTGDPEFGARLGRDVRSRSSAHSESG